MSFLLKFHYVSAITIEKEEEQFFYSLLDCVYNFYNRYKRHDYKIGIFIKDRQNLLEYDELNNLKIVVDRNVNL
jgi:hypothetical protein